MFNKIRSAVARAFGRSPQPAPIARGEMAMTLLTNVRSPRHFVRLWLAMLWDAMGRTGRGYRRPSMVVAGRPFPGGKLARAVARRDGSFWDWRAARRLPS